MCEKFKIILYWKDRQLIPFSSTEFSLALSNILRRINPLILKRWYCNRHDHDVANKYSDLVTRIISICYYTEIMSYSFRVCQWNKIGLVSSKEKDDASICPINTLTPRGGENPIGYYHLNRQCDMARYKAKEVYL